MQSIFTSRSLITAAVLLGTACSSADPESTNGSASTADFRLLAQGDWQLDPGSEEYFCVRKSIAVDTFVAGFRPISPPGTHHSVLSVVTAAADGGTLAPDGTTPCDATTLGPELLGGSGVGTDAYRFPPGIAVKLEKGSQILLNLHLFNASSNPLRGTSGIEIMPMAPSDVVHEAELVEAGKVVGLTVPPGRTTQTGTCTIAKDIDVFSVTPHMHRLGVHQMARSLPAHGDPTVLVDRDYSFDAQTFSMFEKPVSLHAGDRIEVNCTYENPGATTVVFGQSSHDEMCFAATYLYPPLHQGGFCIQ